MAWKSLLVGVFIGAAGMSGVWAQAPKKGYMLVQSDVTNAVQYAAYAKTTPAIVAKYGGTFIARGGRSATLEGRQAPARVVVIEFPSYDAVQTLYNSPEYTAARTAREGAATMQIVAVEGQ